MNDTRLDRLADLAEILRARDMARLGRIARERHDLAQRISQLSIRVEIGDDPGQNAACLAHARWAEGQRIRLNQLLARHTARLLDQKAQSARSLGRALALQRLRGR